MDMDRRGFLATSGALGTLAALKTLPASAAGREGTLLALVGNGPIRMAIHRSGTIRPSYQLAVNLDDRLVTFGSK
jgi:peptide/nickel transport system substrate-binding protein